MNKTDLLPLLDSHFHKNIKENQFFYDVKAKDLLVSTRFDLAFKLFYLDVINENIELARFVYKEHIRAFSLGSFSEPGNSEKNTADAFYKEFKKVYEDIKINSFDSSKSLIPLSENGSIANGAHRVASAIHLDKKVSCVNIDTQDHIYDYKFFHDRKVDTNILDLCAIKFTEYSDNIHVAFLWPTAQGCDEYVEKLIPNIVYIKNIKFTPNGAHNLLSQIYYGEPWLGTPENNYNGVKGKLAECFKSFSPVRVIVFQSDSLDDVLEIKDKIRRKFNVGKHSVHITDTKDEAVRVVRAVLNENGVHFLNNAKPNKYLSVYNKILKWKKTLIENNINFNDSTLDSGMVLSVYGLREAKDIDFFVSGEVKVLGEEFESHELELNFHKVSKVDLIYNPKYFFYFDGLKFLSFEQVFLMKKNRNEMKDKHDVLLMKDLIEKGFYSKIKIKIKQESLYFYIKFKRRFINFLKKRGLFDKFMRFYKVIFK
jgi:hypothetical protein